MHIHLSLSGVLGFVSLVGYIILWYFKKSCKNFIEKCNNKKESNRCVVKFLSWEILLFSFSCFCIGFFAGFLDSEELSK